MITKLRIEELLDNHVGTFDINNRVCLDWKSVEHMSDYEDGWESVGLDDEVLLLYTDGCADGHTEPNIRITLRQLVSGYISEDGKSLLFPSRITRDMNCLQFLQYKVKDLRET